MPRTALMLALILLASGDAAAQSNIDETQSVTVTLNDKSTLVLEDDGTKNGQRLYVLGEELRALDKEIERLKAQANAARGVSEQDPATPKSGLPKSAAPVDNTEIMSSLLAVMEQNRADAAEELQEAWKLSSSRSWGSPAEHLESAQENIQSVRGVLDKSMPTSLYCRTEIKSASEPSHIHYMPEGVFRSGGEDWMSYTPGAKIKIGNYRFRVSGEGAVFNQKVTILQDPFVHVIQPL
ncbi:hypothetical protein [Microbulbifer aggregans]|uniref:hypothetical protein n=1 Tax=Microbulbifer aggregans TaxID=1769779 RepID=UPI001CFEA1A7|nr:hypothetical protein [Microbulbifer aggregans]